MPIPPALAGRLSIPVIASPMFLVSGPELVLEACRAGVVGAFPSQNARTAAALDTWLTRIAAATAAGDGVQPAPFGVNLIVHRTNARLADDLALVVRHRVPLVITSLGDPAPIVAAVHAYGGLVLHDVIMARHARKAIDGGVDGLIAVAAGAGGHSGTQSALSLVRELRELWDGCLVAAGAIGDGFAVRAVEVLGADLAYVGTRFIATRESRATEAYKAMLVASRAGDLVYTDRVSGVYGNFLRPSLAAAGLDPDAGGGAASLALGHEAKAWKTIWSAGHGVSTVHDVPTVAALVARMRGEYAEACRLPPSPAVR